MQDQERLCEIDQVPLSKTQSKYCSKSCSAKGTKSWMYKTPSTNIWTCSFCGIEHQRKNSPFCSPEHRFEHYKKQFIEQSLVYGSSTKSAGLKVLLVKYGILEAKCNICGLDEWLGKKGLDAPLQLDHINGDSKDNTLENVRILCANCHMQTDTYCGKNIKNGYKNRTTKGP